VPTAKTVLARARATVLRGTDGGIRPPVVDSGQGVLSAIFPIAAPRSGNDPRTCSRPSPFLIGIYVATPRPLWAACGPAHRSKGRVCADHRRCAGPAARTRLHLYRRYPLIPRAAHGARLARQLVRPRCRHRRDGRCVVRGRGGQTGSGDLPDLPRAFSACARRRRSSSTIGRTASRGRPASGFRPCTSRATSRSGGSGS
jgi:hypothetical protein